ncbi:hypothetical protein FNU79_09750 [Deinococcus detaillensis]|uniref:Uncharacterized protein n=1 Tax=Deinococcus detaillensis TaxID=2592048 RepID=A0A553UZT2_9DEIO|nr:hypothetical protein [Deinococcus detaillensis]TSA85471.1 hypothetical protein FNU79_09750 [Deinococcus detaillensis]
MVGVDRVVGFVASFEGLSLEPHAAVPVEQRPDLDRAYLLDVRANTTPGICRTPTNCTRAA